MKTLMKLLAFALITWFAALGASLAQADSNQDVRNSTPAVYRAECGACHLAYPSGFLGVQGWRRLSQSLDRHFGADARLDAKELAQVMQYLEADTKRKRGVDVAASGSNPPTRVSGTEWFVRKHHEIAPATWKRASIRSAANCAACHTGAEVGRFSDHDVRIPQ